MCNTYNCFSSAVYLNAKLKNDDSLISGIVGDTSKFIGILDINKVAAADGHQF